MFKSLIVFVKKSFSGPHTWKKGLHIILFCGLIILVVFTRPTSAKTKSAASAGGLEKVVLQLKWYHQFNFAGYYAAVEKGFYREAGLDVTIREGKPGMDFIEEVVSGRAHYGVEMPELLIQRHEGKPVVVLAAVFQHSPQILLARADSGIRSPHDLIGRKVMWRHGSAAELLAMLINEKVPLDRIEFLELSWDIDDLINGRVDAIHAYVTDQPFSLVKAGIDSISLSPLTYGIDFYGDCLFTSEKELSGHPERARLFREASLRGWEYAMENPEELIDIISTRYKTRSSREYMWNEFRHINQLMLPKLIEIGHMNPGRWEHIGDTFVKLDMLDPDYSLEGFLYDPAVKPDYKKLMKIAWGMIFVLLAISFISLILFIYNRNLKRQVLERTNHLSSEIAERKRVEQEISKSKAQFEAIFNSIADAVVFVDTDRKIMMINPAFTRIFGYTLDEIIGRTTEFFYADPDKYREQGQKRYSKDANITKPIYEMDYKRKDGTVFPAETLGAHVKNSAGEVMGFIGVMRDITRRKQVEEEKANLEASLRQAHKMEAIGTMAGGIAHDFNNMLSVILGNADLAKIKTGEESKASDNIDRIVKASSRARDLVQQILAFTRQTEKKTEPIDIVQTTGDSLRLLHATIPKSVEIRRNFDLDAKIFVVADPTQIHQLMLNLCTNAIQAMHEKGILAINLTEENLTDKDLFNQIDKKPGPYIRLTVRDSGGGIAPDILERIFDPFFTTKDIGQGTGMGLSVVHGIVESTGGFITVDSVVGQGTSFDLYFPKADNTRVQKAKIAVTIPTGSERILFIDDEQTLADLGKEILGSLGYAVTTVTNSRAALAMFKSQPDDYDLIVTDMTMPELTGKELAAELLQIRPDVPIILFTGYSSVISKEDAEKAGIRKFCMKPYDTIKLATTVRKVLDEDSARPHSS
ncbi:MAG: ABC transporter substrate-binding protein [Desulfobulbales bacterium]|nr:ABC transporter substrate-binding protein [Desulfobulbales bacterium]